MGARAELGAEAQNPGHVVSRVGRVSNEHVEGVGGQRLAVKVHVAVDDRVEPERGEVRTHAPLAVVRVVDAKVLGGDAQVPRQAAQQRSHVHVGLKGRLAVVPEVSLKGVLRNALEDHDAAATAAAAAPPAADAAAGFMCTGPRSLARGKCWRRRGLRGMVSRGPLALLVTVLFFLGISKGLMVAAGLGLGSLCLQESLAGLRQQPHASFQLGLAF